MTAALESTVLQSPEWSYREAGLKVGRRYALGHLFEWAAEQHPDAPAIADGTVSWTFEQLQRCTNEFAYRLLFNGVREGDRVLVLSEKRAVMAAVAAGIWKAGAVYVPFDAETPGERLADIIGQTQPAAIMGSQRALKVQAETLAETSAPAVAFEEVSDIASSVPLRQVTPPSVAEHEPAYVIFTSGSTGTPKGVVISHGSLLDYFYNHNQVLRFGPGSRVFSLAPFHFDVSIEDTLLPLSVGSYVFQFRGVHLGPVLRKALRRERITHLIAVSTLLGLITEDGSDVYEGAFPDLRMLMTGAEVCDPKLIHLWVQRFPQARVINAYGPTETTIVCLTHTIARSEPEHSSSYPIGQPLSGVDVLLLDDEGRAIDLPGVAGELLIGGSQVMLGYLGRAQETEQACPIVNGKRYYRSGDRCRFDSKGRLVFLERMDDMIKIGGQRVHLGEIRQVALSLPDVAGAAAGEMRVGALSAVTMVVVLRSTAEDPSACAIAAQQIRTSLARRLPAYMLPRVLALTGETRLTSNGKTDERALLERVRQAVPAGKGDFFISHDLGVVPLSGGPR